MKLSDVSTGPDWVIWVVFVVLVILSIVLLSGHGSGLLAGYNTASKEEKEKYNIKKLCRVVGIGMSIMSLLLLIMGLFEDVLPVSFAYISIGIIAVDFLLIFIIGNVCCRK